MQKALRIAGSFWRAVLAVGALLGILYLPQDIGELPVALQKWGPIVGLLTREAALLAFGVVCAAWVVWIDVRPYAKQQWAIRFRKAPPANAVTPSIAETAPTTPTRDVSVSNAIAHIAFGSWGRSFYDAVTSPDVDGLWEKHQFEQAAADEVVSVWGRQGEARVYEPISKEFWRDNSVEWFGLLENKPYTEPIRATDRTQKKYIELMTCRSEIERLFRNQPPEVLKEKSSARRLANLFKEGVEMRNRLLPVMPEFDKSDLAVKFSEWNKRVLATMDDAGVEEGKRSRFEILDRYHPESMGSPDRPPAQIKLETILNKKLEILRIIVDGIGRR